MVAQVSPPLCVHLPAAVTGYAAMANAWMQHCVIYLDTTA